MTSGSHGFLPGGSGERLKADTDKVSDQTDE